MNKKVYGVVIGIFFIGIGIFFIANTQYGLSIKNKIIPTGTIRAKIDSPKTANSSIGLKAKKGGKFRVNYSSNVKEGNLNIKLCYGTELIENFDVDIQGEKEVTLEEDRDITLWVEQNRFIGEYNIKVYE